MIHSALPLLPVSTILLYKALIYLFHKRITYKSSRRLETLNRDAFLIRLIVWVSRLWFRTHFSSFVIWFWKPFIQSLHPLSISYLWGAIYCFLQQCIHISSPTWISYLWTPITLKRVNFMFCTIMKLLYFQLISSLSHFNFNCDRYSTEHNRYAKLHIKGRKRLTGIFLLSISYLDPLPEFVRNWYIVQFVSVFAGLNTIWHQDISPGYSFFPFEMGQVRRSRMRQPSKDIQSCTIFILSAPIMIV